MKVVLKGLTKKQAQIFAEWYAGQGEQDADVWFEEHGTETPMVDVNNPAGWKKEKKNKIIVYCR